jgi:hypothetical protein
VENLIGWFGACLCFSVSPTDEQYVYWVKSRNQVVVLISEIVKYDVFDLSPKLSECTRDNSLCSYIARKQSFH